MCVTDLLQHYTPTQSLNADVAPFCHSRQACVRRLEMQNDYLFRGCLLVCSIEETEPKSLYKMQ